MQSSRQGQEIGLRLQSELVCEVVCSRTPSFVQWLASPYVGGNRGRLSSIAVQEPPSHRTRARFINIAVAICPGLPSLGRCGESMAVCVSLLGCGGPR